MKLSVAFSFVVALAFTRCTFFTEKENNSTATTEINISEEKDQLLTGSTINLFFANNQGYLKFQQDSILETKILTLEVSGSWEDENLDNHFPDKSVTSFIPGNCSAKFPTEEIEESNLSENWTALDQWQGTRLSVFHQDSENCIRIALDINENVNIKILGTPKKTNLPDSLKNMQVSINGTPHEWDFYNRKSLTLSTTPFDSGFQIAYESDQIALIDLHCLTNCDSYQFSSNSGEIFFENSRPSLMAEFIYFINPETKAAAKGVQAISDYTIYLPLFINETQFEIWEGDLNLASIGNISALDGINVVERDLIIENINWETLKDLVGFYHIGRDLIIRDNSKLISLEGLGSLIQIGGSIVIENNPELTKASDLSKIREFGGGIRVQNNPKLSSLLILSNISSIPKSFVLVQNTTLGSLAGLETISEIGDSLIIAENHSMADLGELSGLKSIGLSALYPNGLLQIENNDKLTDLEDFSSLERIQGLVNISNNKDLQNLDHLNEITGGFKINISSNPSLERISGFNKADSVDLTIQANENLQNISGFNMVEKASLIINSNH